MKGLSPACALWPAGGAVRGRWGAGASPLVTHLCLGPYLRESPPDAAPLQRMESPWTLCFACPNRCVRLAPTSCRAGTGRLPDPTQGPCADSMPRHWTPQLGFDVSDLDGQLAGCLGPEADTEGEEGGGRGEGNASGLTVQRRFSGPAADAVSADATSAKAKQALGEAYDDDEDDEEEEEEDGKKEEEEAAKEIVRRRWRPDDNVSIDEFLTHLASMARWAGTSEDTLVQRAQVVLEDARASDEALAAATGPTPAEKTEIEMYPDLRSGTPRAVADKLPRSPVDRALTAGRIDAETVRAATSLESDGGAAVAAVGDEQMRAALAGEVTDTMEDEEDDEETRRQLLDQELAMLRRQEVRVG